MYLFEREQNQAVNIMKAINEVPENFPKDMEIDCDSPEWKHALDLAEKEENQSYTIIYRDTDDNLKEAWHWLSEMNMKYVRNKYKHQKKDVIYIGLKTMEFGAKLSSMKGSSKNELSTLKEG
jgi:hypothetical protein